MKRASYERDRAFVAARPELRKRLGFANADDVEHYYQLFRAEHTAVERLILILEHELVASKIALICAHQSWLQQRDMALVESILDGRHGTKQDQPLSPWRDSANFSTAKSLKSGPRYQCLLVSKIEDHNDLAQKCVKALYSLVSVVAFDSRQIRSVLQKLDTTVLLTSRRLHELYNDICVQFLPIETLNQSAMVEMPCDKNGSSTAKEVDELPAIASNSYYRSIVEVERSFDEDTDFVFF